MQHEKNVDLCWNLIGVWGSSTERCKDLEKYFHCQNCPVYTSLGRKLLDRPIPSDYQLECTTLLAKEKKSKATNTESAFVFRAGGEWLALPAELVEEVVDMGSIHSIPHRSNSTLRGIVNVRGKLEICLSIGGILGLERGEKPIREGYVTPERLVVASRRGQKIVFPVSEVVGIVKYTPEMLRNLPVTVSGSKAVLTRCILCLEDMDVGFLEDKQLFDALAKNLI